MIIDNVMNLELLFWASKNGGTKSMYDKAYTHAVTTMTNHVRPNGSTYHLVTYDEGTGRVRRRSTVQGYRDWSTWSRGQAWAIYGFTTAYRETGDARFLVTARKTADYYTARLPADKVPYWDFNAPTTREPRDSSAAAIAASGLLELSRVETSPSRAASYLSAAKATLQSLSSPRYLAGTTHKAVLLHGTANRPKGYFDAGLVDGDYYFLEALVRYRRSTATARAPGAREQAENAAETAIGPAVR